MIPGPFRPAAGLGSICSSWQLIDKVRLEVGHGMFATAGLGTCLVAASGKYFALFRSAFELKS